MLLNIISHWNSFDGINEKIKNIITLPNIILKSMYLLTKQINNQYKQCVL